MSIDKSVLAELLSPLIDEKLRSALREIRAGATDLKALDMLRCEMKAELAAAIVEMAKSRIRAQAKMSAPFAENLFSDREGLEMASGAACAAYHAQRLIDVGVRSVIDTSCGIGLDAIAFASAGMKVFAYERDPVRAAFAARNALSAGVSDRVTVICADSREAEWPKGDAVWMDPMRRSDSQRWQSDPELLSPPLSEANRAFQQGFKHVLAKLPTGIDQHKLSGYAGETTFVSEQGECKEAVFMVSDTVKESVNAVILTNGAKLSSFDESDLTIGDMSAAYLYEPDPAVIRAGLVDRVTKLVAGWRIDARSPYILSDAGAFSPFADVYHVIEQGAYHPKALSRTLRERGIGKVILKKRGFDRDIEDVRREMRLSGDKTAIVALTTVGVSKRYFLLERMDSRL
jgi:hypothetical protein